MLHHREIGSGEPIVLLHPGPGLDGSVFFPWFERLADRYRLIAPDLPGSGRSDDPAEFSLPGLAAEVEAFADSLGLERYTLLGHSFGGFVALTHAVERPARLTRVVASCTAATESAFDDLEQRVRAFDPAVDAAFVAEEQATTPDELRDAWLAQLPFFLADPEGPARAEIETVWRDVLYRPGAGDHDWGELELLKALERTEMPLLAIGGAEDRMTRPPASEQIAVAAPKGACVEIERAGHFAYAERPAQYFSALEGWLSRTG